MTTRPARQVNSLIRAFCAGIKAQSSDDLTGNTFLQMPFIIHPKLEVIRQLAERYGVNVRTIYRWQRDGVNVGDPCEVGLYLAGLKHKDTASLVAAKTELETIL